MNNVEDKLSNAVSPRDGMVLTGARHRTLQGIFRHPIAHNLEWADVVSLFQRIGTVDHRGNDEFTFDLAGHHHVMRKPHTKDLASSEVAALRAFLSGARWSADGAPIETAVVAPTTRNLLVVMDHHDARIYRIGEGSESGTPDEKIEPYDPHHFLHHLTHRDESREKGQRAPEDVTFYERIAEALKPAERVVVIGHGTGKSNAAHHLMEYLNAHEIEIHHRVSGEAVADLSSSTTPELIKLARSILQQNVCAV